MEASMHWHWLSDLVAAFCIADGRLVLEHEIARRLGRSRRA